MGQVACRRPVGVPRITNRVSGGRGSLRVAGDDACVDVASHHRRADSTFAERSTEVRDVLALAHRYRVRRKFGVHFGLRIRGRVQRESGASPCSAARYAAVDSCAEFFAPGDGGDGRALSDEATGS